jgi:hypothetical protein
MKESVAAWLAGSQAQEAAVYLLGNVPGLPPIAQSLHILGIAVVMSSTVMIHLRILGLAAPSQQIGEMIGRLMPWTWWALLVNAITGLLFVVGRPNRYFFNPVFGWKFMCLVPAVGIALVIYRMNTREPGYWERTAGRLISARVMAVASLVLWVGVVLAGRWIAYTDYLYFLYE